MTYQITFQFDFPPTFGWFKAWHTLLDKKPGYSNRVIGFGPIVIGIATMNRWKLT